MPNTTRPIDPLQEAYWPVEWALAWISNDPVEAVKAAASGADVDATAIPDLLSACRRGEVIAIGLFEGDTFPREIRPIEWAHLEIEVRYKRFPGLPTPFMQQMFEVRTAVHPRINGVTADRFSIVNVVKFCAADLQRKWPPPALAAAEAGDTATAAGSVAWEAALAATEAGDTAEASGLAGAIGAMASTEAGDTAAIAGSVAWAVPLTVTEAADSANFTAVREEAGSLAGTGAGVDIGQRQRTPSEKARAERALKALFGERIPTQDEVSNPKLGDKVNAWLEEHDLERVKRDSILRAARRRRN